MSYISEKAASASVDTTSLNKSVEQDGVRDKALLRKVDWKLLPILTLLYLLSFLDRSNIGNAKIDGLVTDLKVTGSNYNVALALFFVSYIAFEVPSNIILKRFDPQYWLPSLALVWGVVSICQGLVKNQAGLLGIRTLLGAAEAGLFPGITYLFSVYYRRHERHWRVGLFFGGAAVAGAFGGILAYAIGLMDGVGGRRGWQWIFIIEGLITVAVSLASYFLVPTWPHKAKFLTSEEREELIARLTADSDAGKHETFQWVFVRQAFQDKYVWAYALLFHGFAYGLYSLSLFLPTIIAGLGFQTWQAQLMTVPPYALAALCVGLNSFASSHFKKRAPFILIASSVAIIGYIILVTGKTAGAQYVGVHLATAGIYAGNSLILSWPGENVSGQTKRAIAVAMQITIGDIGAIAGVLIYRPAFSGHRFRKPHIISIGYVVFAMAVTTYLWISMGRENRKRDASTSEKSSKAELTKEEYDAARLFEGDKHVDFRYQV